MLTITMYLKNATPEETELLASLQKQVGSMCYSDPPTLKSVHTRITGFTSQGHPAQVTIQVESV